LNASGSETMERKAPHAGLSTAEGVNRVKRENTQNKVQLSNTQYSAIPVNHEEEECNVKSKKNENVEEEVDTWELPVNQTGDGKTWLNEKFGY